MLSDLVFWLRDALWKLALTARNCRYRVGGHRARRAVDRRPRDDFAGDRVARLLFLALDHDKAFLAESAVGGLAVNSVNGIFMVVYAALARRRGLAVSLLVALACWIILAAAARTVPGL